MVMIDHCSSDHSVVGQSRSGSCLTVPSFSATGRGKIRGRVRLILAAPHNLSSIIHSDLTFMILFLMEEKEPGLRAFVKKSA